MVELVRLNIIVEGQAEETFVRDILRDHLGARQILVSVRRVVTKQDKKTSTFYRGGLSKYEKAKGDIERWLKEDKQAYLTTMFDLYALPDDFPNFTEAKKQLDPYRKVRLVEEGMAADISSRRFIAYIQLHEYEGLLFSSVETIDEVLSIYGSSKLSNLQNIRNRVNTPEEINDGATTAPSKQLIALYKTYQKVTLGVLISKRIGLERMRRECPHFNEWLSKLESLGQQGEAAE